MGTSRYKICKYYVPFEDMLGLCDAALLYNISNQKCNLETMLQNVKESADDKSLNMTSLRIVMQCCADLANSEWISSTAKSWNQTIRNELLRDFKIWKQIARTKNVNDTMTHCMNMKAKLDKLCIWSL